MGILAMRHQKTVKEQSALDSFSEPHQPSLANHSMKPSQGNNNVSILSKPNPAIMSVSNLSRKEKLYANVCLANAQSTLGKQRVHSIPLADFRELSGYNRKDYAELKRTFANLMSKIVHIGKLEDDDSPWKAMSWLAEVSIENGLLRYEYSTSMETVLQEFARLGYTRLDILIQKELRSKHSLDLYEIGKRYARVHSTGWKSMDWWRQAFNATSNAYTSWSYFYRDVIKPAIKEVNTKTDLSLHLYKRGRPVQEIRFSIEPNPNFVHPLGTNKNTLITEQKTNNKNLDTIVTGTDLTLDILRNEFGISSAKAIETIQSQFKHPADLLTAIDYLLKKKRSGQITHNLSGYAYKSLTNFTPPSKPNKQTRKNKLLPEPTQKQEEKQNNDYTLYVREQITSHYNQQSHNKQEAIQAEFIRYLSQRNSIAFVRRLIEAVETGGIFCGRTVQIFGFLKDFYIECDYLTLLSEENFTANNLL